MASEDFATEAQIKRLYAVLHSVGLDPKQWKKDANIASYAKLTRAQCSTYIDEAEALEAEQKDVGSYHPDGIGDAATDEENAALAVEQQKKDKLAAEVQKIREEQGRATPAAEAVPAQPAAPPTVEELIFKYIDILAKVTVAVEQEDRIPEREKGYAVKFIYYSVKAAVENGKNGGDHEEQA